MAQSPEERRAAVEARLAERRAKREADREARSLRPDDLAFYELRKEWREEWDSGKGPGSQEAVKGPEEAVKGSQEAFKASKILGEVRRYCDYISKQYLASDYSQNDRASTPIGNRWSNKELDDLYMRAVDWLFGAAGKTNQLTYAFDNAKNIHHWRTLIRKQIMHMLAHRRNKTTVDNLVERAKKLLGGPLFKSREIEGTDWYSLGSRPDPDPDDRLALQTLQGGNLDRVRHSEKFASARTRVSLVKRKKIRETTDPEVLSRRAQRAPSIMDDSQLTLCLEGIGRCYPHGFTLRHVEQILKDVLTFLDVPGLTNIETKNSVTENESDDVSENLIVDIHRADHSETERLALSEDNIRIMLDGFTETDLEILRRHLHGEGLEKIGLDLDIGSRPTVTKRLNQIKETLRERGSALLGPGSTQEDILADLESALLDELVRGVSETDPPETDPPETDPSP